MNDEVESSFTTNPAAQANVIDGNAIIAKMKADRAAVDARNPNGSGMMHNRTTGETIVSEGTTPPKELSLEDKRFGNLEKLKEMISEQGRYIDDNQMDFTRPEYNGKRYAKLSNTDLIDEIKRQQESTDRLIEMNEYDPDGEVIEEEMIDEEADYEEFIQDYPSLQDGAKYPSDEDMGRMSDRQIERWFNDI